VVSGGEEIRKQAAVLGRSAAHRCIAAAVVRAHAVVVEQAAAKRVRRVGSSPIRLNLSDRFISHGIVFFSHNKSANSTFRENNNDSRRM
jgi:hypothetical protein